MELSVQRTLIFVVDELDRCLPEYSILVLERLHHLMEGLRNTQMLLAVDAEQLEHTVRQIFGEGADVSKYLSKFIEFKVFLSEGEPIEYELFISRFEEYRRMFNAEPLILNYNYTNDISRFIGTVFNGIEIRRKIALVNKCQLIHSFCASGMGVLDPIYMCLELLLSVLHYNGIELYYGERSIKEEAVYEHPRSKLKMLFAGMRSMIEIIETEGLYHDPESMISYINQNSFWGWFALLDYSLFKEMSTYVRCLDIPTEFAPFEEYAKGFWTYLNTIV
jgi:hypothetical protein